MAHDTERLGDLLDSLVPVLVERLHETGLGEIEIERDGAIVRVRAEDLSAPVASVRAQTPNCPLFCWVKYPTAHRRIRSLRRHRTPRQA